MLSRVRVTLVPVSYLSPPSAVHSYRVPVRIKQKFIRIAYLYSKCTDCRIKNGTCCMGITMDVYFKYWVQCGILIKTKQYSFWIVCFQILWQLFIVNIYVDIGNVVTIYMVIRKSDIRFYTTIFHSLDICCRLITLDTSRFWICEVRLYASIALLLCPVCSLISWSDTPARSRRVVVDALNEWFEKFPTKPAAFIIPFTTPSSLLWSTDWK